MVKEEKERLIGFISPKVVLTKLIPFKWCLAINLFNRVYAERNLSRTELQHELIHSLQMKDLGYVRFYLSYLCEWIRLLFKYKSWYLGYLNVSYEKEAYTYQADIDYIVKKYERVCKKRKHKMDEHIVDSSKTCDGDNYQLSRFLRAQDYASGGYDDALREVADGHKRNHWIWYIFPQIKGLGHSSRSEYYGIGCLEEAKAYLEHEVLGERLREISNVLFQLEGKTAIEILGGIDAMKVKSCMTLFDMVSPHDVFERVLEKYYEGKRCKLTLQRCQP